MSDVNARFHRVVIISDLHLGGADDALKDDEVPVDAAQVTGTPEDSQPTNHTKKAASSVMMSRPDRLSRFLRELCDQVSRDEKLELVIAGDFVDFLAIEPWASWTPDPTVACEKLTKTMNSKLFGPVFDALRDLVSAGCAITILLGNHDLELALPEIQEALWRRLAAGPHEVMFSTDGRAYRIGGLLIEHGNRYDGANENDWENLRIISSASSRAEPIPVALRTSFGSQFVTDHLIDLKAFYPFLDLLQPQNELVALLILAFEPELFWDWNMICASRKAQKLQDSNPKGLQPGKTYCIAASPMDEPDEDLRNLFGEVYDQLLRPPQEQEIGARTLMQAYRQNRHESVAAFLRRNEAIPADRLKQIRALLRRVLDDDTADLNHPTGQYGKAAERLIMDGHGIQVVVMGHTHLPRLKPYGHGWYINTGTWIDRIRVPSIALDDNDDGELENFLKALLDDRRPDCPSTYADIRIGCDGHIVSHRLTEAR